MTDPPYDWRAYLPALEGYPLLPCGAGLDGKAPLDPQTGGPATGWQSAAWAPSQIAALNGQVLCCGTRTGPDAGGLLVFDLDGPSAIAYCRDHGCDPSIRTWHIVRNTDPNRYKIAFKVPPDLWGHLSGKRKHKTSPGEQIELFFGTGQVIILGTHRPSGGFYYWPEHHTPADIIEPPPEWWALALQLGSDASSGGINLDDRPSLPLHTCADDLSRAADALRHLDPSCPYDDWIKIGMSLHAIDPSAGFAVWDRWSAGSSKYPGAKALEHHWRSFKANGNGRPPAAAGSIFRAAKAAGWHDPTRQARQAAHSGSQGPVDGAEAAEPDERPQRRRSELLDAALDAAEAGDHDTHAEVQAELMSRFRMTGSQVQAALFRLLTQRRAATTATRPGFVNVATVEHLDHLIPGFIAAHEQTLLHAPKGTGKTLAALAIARSVVSGTPLLDQGTHGHHGRVLYLATDSGCASMHTQMQELGLLDDPYFIHGHPLQRFFLRGHDAAQGISAWEATIDEILWLLNAINDQQFDLVIIDSAKACLSLTDVDYTDNKAVGALLTLFQRVIAPRCAILWLHHDGRETGHNAGAKAWAEIPVIVHRIERVEPPKGQPRGSGEDDQGQPSQNARRWVCAKSRIAGDERDFVYCLSPDGRLEVAPEVEIVGNCRDAVIQVLDQAAADGQDALPWGVLASRVLQLHGRSPKTVKNTISRMARGRSPELIRPRPGLYSLSPKLKAEIALICAGATGTPSREKSVIERDLGRSQQSPDGTSLGLSGSPDGTTSGPRRDQGKTQAGTEELPNRVPTHTHTPMAQTAEIPTSAPHEALTDPTPEPVRSGKRAGSLPAAGPMFQPGDVVAVISGSTESRAVIIEAPSAKGGQYLVRLDDGRTLPKSEGFLAPWVEG